jgi:hypothetical protein
MLELNIYDIPNVLSDKINAPLKMAQNIVHVPKTKYSEEKRNEKNGIAENPNFEVAVFSWGRIPLVWPMHLHQLPWPSAVSGRRVILFRQPGKKLQNYNFQS